MVNNKLKTPLILTIFGVTSNLFQNKIFSALTELYDNNLLPEKTKIIAYTRRDWDKNALKDYLIKLYPQYSNEGIFELFEVINGDFSDDSGFENLSKLIKELENSWEVCANKMYYLAISPQHFKQVITNMSRKNLQISCESGEINPKILIEKPFGLSLKEAEILTAELDKVFDEQQIFRIDHYLGKSIVRESESFYNKYFNSSLGGNITKVEVSLLSKSGVKERVDFFEKVGAFRDTGQNHCMQMLAELLAPLIVDKSSLVEKKLALLDSLVYISSQFEQSLEYKNHSKTNHPTDTFYEINFKSKVEILKNADIIIRGGKYREREYKSIKIFSNNNYIEYQLHPENAVLSYINGVEEKRMIDIFNDYAAILNEAINSQKRYFVTREEIIKQWEIAQPIIEDIPHNLKFH